MRIALILLALSLGGCSSLKGTFENRISCTLDGQKALISSMYGPIGITSKVADGDAQVACKK